MWAGTVLAGQGGIFIDLDANRLEVNGALRTAGTGDIVFVARSGRGIQCASRVRREDADQGKRSRTKTPILA